MDEHDLWSLGREPLGPDGRARPVEHVLRRGRGLRRRAAVTRATVAVTAVALVAGAGVLATRPAEDADVTVSGPDRQLPVKWTMCDQPEAVPVPAEELDGLRLLPTTLPDGVEVDVARPVRQGTGTCVVADPALVLRADGGDGTVEAEIMLEGPFGEPYLGADDVVLDPTELRGGAASRTSDHTAPEASGGFTWTEPDGTSWLLNGAGVTEQELRDVAEALVLHGASPPEGEPAATLPDDAVPDRFGVEWQSPGLPHVEGPSHLEWRVTTTPPAPAGCEITLETTDLEAPPGHTYTVGPDVQAYQGVAVRGTEGFAVEENGQVFLNWQEAPGVVGKVWCTGDVQTAVEVADSLVEVEPGDPRIDAGTTG